jgi:aminoglycoside phosphotransferase
MSTLRNVQQLGLEWERSPFGIEPKWTAEPSIAIIKTLASQALECGCAVAFLAEGAFNKVYSVDCSKGAYVFRVALPVAPQVKTLSEVATLSFIREKTSIPVPAVTAYSADFTNELGFEWILMDRVRGRPLEEQWKLMSWLEKQILVQKMVSFMSELSRLELSGIGSVYEAQASSTADDEVASGQGHVVGETVLPAFFMDDHIRLDVNRGPYATSSSYVTAHAAFLHHGFTAMSLSPKTSRRSDGEKLLAQLTKLSSIIARLFPNTTQEEHSYIAHQDLSVANIMVDDAGVLTGIIDWESTVAAPRWQACKIPRFLAGGNEDEVPDWLTGEELQDEEVVQGYDEAVFDYEQTQLRRFFLEEMARVDPQWVQTYNAESTRRDVMVAMESLYNGMRVKCVKKWMDCVLEGRTPMMTLFDAVMDPLELPKDWA